MVLHRAYLLAILCSLNFCNIYHNSKMRIVLLNELQECETQIFHYTINKIISGNPPTEKDLVGEAVLPVLCIKLNTKENNELLFPIVTNRRIALTVDGFYSYFPHGETLDACKGLHCFKITNIVQVKDVTDSMTFPIEPDLK